MKKTANAELGRPTAEQFAGAEKIPLTVVLDNIRSLNNVGSVFRTCDAFAVERLVLCGITAAPPSKEIHKTALGAEMTVRWEYEQDTTEALLKLKKEGYVVCALEQASGSVDLAGFVPEKGVKYALVAGNEVDGVGQQAIDLCDMALEIPQLGTKHSLNVAVATGVAIWSFFSNYIRS